jgi:hypothetical protein
MALHLRTPGARWGGRKEEATSSMRHKRHKTAACLGGLTSFICTVAKKLSWRCTFEEFESLSASLLVVFRALTGFIREGEREGGDGRDSTPKKITKLMPALKSRCWRQKLKVLAFEKHVLTRLIVVPRPAVAQAVACGKATPLRPLSQQEKSTRQMSTKK